jgi:hypothetical protein
MLLCSNNHMFRPPLHKIRLNIFPFTRTPRSFNVPISFRFCYKNCSYILHMSRACVMVCLSHFHQFGHPVISGDTFRLGSYNWEEHWTVQHEFDQVPEIRMWLNAVLWIGCWWPGLEFCPTRSVNLCAISFVSPSFHSLYSITLFLRFTLVSCVNVSRVCAILSRVISFCLFVVF